MSISVILPTLQAKSYLKKLIPALQSQNRPAEEILIVDSSSDDGTAELAREMGCNVKVIPREEFNHGATRNWAAQQAVGDILVFMTQDALPVDDDFLGNLVAPIESGEAATAFARQIPYESANPLEAFARNFNYPPESRMRSLDDLPKLGIKTFFFSNVSSAYDREVFEKYGGFAENLVINEDFILSVNVIKGGYSSAYQADSRVYHSHSYSLLETFQRYFDIGSTHTLYANLMKGIKTDSEGRKFAFRQLSHLFKTGQWHWIPRSFIESAAKFLGYKMGLLEKRFPRYWKHHFSLHPRHWYREDLSP